MKPRHAAALALVGSLAFGCLTGCATYRVNQMVVEVQDRDVLILSYKYGWFGPFGDEGQQIAIAASICSERGYPEVTTLVENERCITHEWQIPYLFAACYGSVLEGSYHCLDPQFPTKNPFSI